MFTRRSVSFAGGICLIQAGVRSRAELGNGLRRVGVLTASSESLAVPYLAALKQCMRELGWQEGKNIEYRFVPANGMTEWYGALAAALRGVDVVVLTGGIGENAAALRGRILQGAAWLGLQADAACAQGPRPTRDASPVGAWVLRTDEEAVIARHTAKHVASPTIG